MTSNDPNPFGARARLSVDGGEVEIHRLDALEREGVATVSDLPFSIKVLLESVLRQVDGALVTADHVRNLARWDSTRDFRPWLFAIAGNRCRTWLAARKRRPRPATLLEDTAADARPISLNVPARPPISAILSVKASNG